MVTGIIMPDTAMLQNPRTATTMSFKHCHSHSVKTNTACYVHTHTASTSVTSPALITVLWYLPTIIVSNIDNNLESGEGVSWLNQHQYLSGSQKKKKIIDWGVMKGKVNL